MWPETSGTVTPLFLAKKSLFFLPKFKWFESIRPRDRFDIFVVPDEMEQLMATAPRPKPEEPAKPKASIQPMPAQPAAEPAPETPTEAESAEQIAAEAEENQ